MVQQVLALLLLLLLLLLLMIVVWVNPVHGLVPFAVRLAVVAGDMSTASLPTGVETKTVPEYSSAFILFSTV